MINNFVCICFSEQSIAQRNLHGLELGCIKQTYQWNQDQFHSNRSRFVNFFLIKKKDYIINFDYNYKYINTNRHVKTRAFKALQTLEKDLHTLYQIQVKYLEKVALKNNKPNGAAALSSSSAVLSNQQSSSASTLSAAARFSAQSKTSSAYLTQSKQIEKLVNHTPIGNYWHFYYY